MDFRVTANLLKEIIQSKRVDVIKRLTSESAAVPFIVCRWLSFNPSCVEEMSRRSGRALTQHAEAEDCYKFLMHATKRKNFSYTPYLKKPKN